MDAIMSRPSKPRLVLFAFGDFAFNLFWQSIMLFLLFYYTDALQPADRDRGNDVHGGVSLGRRRQFHRRASWSTVARPLPLWLLLAAGAIPLGPDVRARSIFPPAAGGAWAVATRVRRTPPVSHRLCRRQRALSRDDRADQRRSRRPCIRRRHADVVRHGGCGGRRACARFHLAGG